MKKGYRFLLFLCLLPSIALAQLPGTQMPEHTCDDFVVGPINETFQGVVECSYGYANCYVVGFSQSGDIIKGEPIMSGLACDPKNSTSATLCSKDDSNKAYYCLRQGQDVLKKLRP